MTGFGPPKRIPPASDATEVKRLKAEVRRLRQLLAAREEELLARLKRYEPDAA